MDAEARRQSLDIQAMRCMETKQTLPVAVLHEYSSSTIEEQRIPTPATVISRTIRPTGSAGGRVPAMQSAASAIRFASNLVCRMQCCKRRAAARRCGLAAAALLLSFSGRRLRLSRLGRCHLHRDRIERLLECDEQYARIGAQAGGFVDQFGRAIGIRAALQRDRFVALVTHLHLTLPITTHEP